MSKNVGTIDRVARGLLGLVLLWLAFFSGVAAFDAGLLKWIAALVGVVMLATSALSSCPLYSMPGVSTCPRS